jgi:hypothetical protein
MVTANRKMPKNRLLTNPSNDGKRAKVESPTMPIQSTATIKRAFLNVGRKNNDA